MLRVMLTGFKNYQERNPYLPVCPTERRAEHVALSYHTFTNSTKLLNGPPPGCMLCTAGVADYCPDNEWSDHGWFRSFGKRLRRFDRIALDNDQSVLIPQLQPPGQLFREGRSKNSLVKFLYVNKH